MAKKSTVDIVFLLQLALAIFFIVLGIQSIMYYREAPDFWTEINRFFNHNRQGISDELTLTMGILSLVAGLLLVLGLFNVVNRRTLRLFVLLIFIIWIVRIIVLRFIGGVHVGNGNISFSPDFMTWLLNFSSDLVVLCSLWLIEEKYAEI